MLAIAAAELNRTPGAIVSMTKPDVCAPIDANGNLTADGTRSFEWDALNQLLAVSVSTHRSEFTYDGDRRRARSVEKENSVTIRDANVVWDDDDVVEERLTTSAVNRYFIDGESVGSAARYLTRDHLASIRESVDATAALSTRNEFDPYGRLTRVADSEDSSFGFTGHFAHSPSNLAMAHYRAYDPTVARFPSEDPIGLDGGPNLYSYSWNNPIRFSDPSGLSPADCCDRDLLACVARCIERLDPLGPYGDAALTGAGGTFPKKVLRQRQVMRATPRTTLLSVASKKTGFRSLRTVGRVFSPIWITYGNYLFLMEIHCFSSCVGYRCSY